MPRGRDSFVAILFIILFHPPASTHCRLFVVGDEVESLDFHSDFLNHIAHLVANSFLRKIEFSERSENDDAIKNLRRRIKEWFNKSPWNSLTHPLTVP